MNNSKDICKHPDNIYQNKNGNVKKTIKHIAMEIITLAI